MKPYSALITLCFSLTLASDSPLQEFTSGNNLFTASVYTQIKNDEKGNFMVSPFSAETILALTQSGAKDATAEEIRTGLNLPKTQEKIEAAVKSLKPVLRKSDLYTLQTANKIYLKNDFVIKDGFKKVATEVFDAELENIDFNQGREAASSMNKWVADKTEEKITNLIQASDLNDRTRTVLINALYFKGNWTNTFEKYLTKKSDFFKNGVEAVQVDTMRDDGSYKYYEDKELDAKFIELPFQGEDVSLTVVLPNQKNGLPAIENQLGKVLKSPAYANEYVHLVLPKFKIESLLDFVPILKKLGITKAFRDDEADLSGISGEKGDLVIDQVKQKTFIDVNEDGVEAAAATFVAVGVPLSGIVALTPPKEFIADHPFIFYIKTNDLILFAGRVVDPSQ